LGNTETTPPDGVDDSTIYDTDPPDVSITAGLQNDDIVVN
jgi:hypothetical protein